MKRNPLDRPDRGLASLADVEASAKSYLLGDDGQWDVLVDGVEERGVPLRQARLFRFSKTRGTSKKAEERWTDPFWRFYIAARIVAAQWSLDNSDADDPTDAALYRTERSFLTHAPLTRGEKDRAMREFDQRWSTLPPKSSHSSTKAWMNHIWIEWRGAHPADVPRIEDNPRARKRGKAVVELGKLTRLTWEGGGSKAWALAAAPSLVADGDRLLIVYDVALSDVRVKAGEVSRYAWMHWGSFPKNTSLSEGDTAEGPFARLGKSLAITYTTKKGSREVVDFVHRWGEGAKGRSVSPVVERGLLGRLRLVGGTYRVTDRGIVG